MHFKCNIVLKQYKNNQHPNIIIFNRGILAELSRARSAHNEAPWVRKSGNLCIQEILVLRNSSVRSTYVRPPSHVSQHEILHLKHSRGSAVNRTASRTCTDESINFIFRLVDIKINDFYFVKTFVQPSPLAFSAIMPCCVIFVFKGWK